MGDELTIVEIKNSRDSEEAPLVMEQVFAALGVGRSHGILEQLFGPKEHRWFSFEIGVFQSIIHFYVVTPTSAFSYLESQLSAQYPKIMVTAVADYVPPLMANPHALTQLTLTSPSYYHNYELHLLETDGDKTQQEFSRAALLTRLIRVGLKRIRKPDSLKPK
ncbi:MAG: hypothetical protein UU25_C0020G0008 [Microgenomates group bacterium GW2011_GWB1_40_9]|nr:MAG: hypothetical protein UU25_C0020G0008 [Microgenomates group bacterium GW2011_GWB1_40_9]